MPRTTKSRTNLLEPITTASRRSARTTPSKSTVKASDAVKKTGAPASKERGGKSTGLTKASTTGGGSSGRITKKREGRLSEASKARKRNEKVAAKLTTMGEKAAKTMKGNAKQSGHVGNDSPAGAPKPKKVFNDEWNNIDFEYEAEVIRDSKIEGGKLCYLVKWVGWPEEANTWEPEINLRNSIDLITEFDNLHPEKP